MKLTRLVLFLVFLGSLFLGITGISIGLGTVYPSVNRITRPFLCPRGEMIVETQTYRPVPGETITTLTWYCADRETGARTELSILAMTLYAGAIYGLGLFVVVAGGLYLYARLYEKWDLHAYFRTPEGRKMEERLAYGLGAVLLIAIVGSVIRMVAAAMP